MFEPPAKKYPAYIFDCDGTLVDSMPLHMQAWNAGLQAAGATFLLDGPGFLKVAGMSLEQTVSFWRNIYSSPLDLDVIVEAKNQFYEQHRQNVTPIESVVAFARELAQLGTPIAVASGGRLDDVRESLHLIGALSLFQVIVAADDVAKGKPEPDLFLLAAKRLGVLPQDCLVIEDSPLGIEAANRAGMDSILIPAPWSA